MIPEVPSILFGAAFTVAISIALGWLLLRCLQVDLYRQEAPLFAFVTGAACLSLATFFLCLIHQARPGVFLGGGFAAIAWAGWQSRSAPRQKSLPRPETAWLTLFLIVFTVFFIAYFFNALAPEFSPDGSGYHLGNVARYSRTHGFDWNHHSMYSHLSQGLEMLFLIAFSFGGHSSAALVHFAFLTTLPLLMVCYGIRSGFPRAAMFAAILTYASPIIGVDGTSAYNDLALVTVIFAVFYLLQVWHEALDPKLLIIIGLLSGFSFAIKYSGCFTLPFALAFISWRFRGRRSSRDPVISAIIAAAAASIMILPWAIRNWAWVGNPLAPFLNRWFPNPYFHPGMEQTYLSDLGRYEGIKHYWEIPVQLAFRGGLIPGIIGPAFLLAPFALLALRNPHGRRLLLAAVVFGIPQYFNKDARFLIPSMPFVALAMGLGLANSWGVLPAAAMFQALVCWPSILSIYCDPWAWRIRSVPIQAALRKEPETEFLSRQLRGYDLKSPIEQATATTDSIFTFAGRPEAYIDREIVVGYESAQGNLIQDILWTAQTHPPVDRRRYVFPPVLARAISIEQKSSARNYWSIAEIRLYSQGRELHRAPGWRLSAKPNPDDVGLAFDGNCTTRWSTWQGMSPNDRLQIDFDEPQALDEIVLESEVSLEAQVSVEIRTESGKWIPATGSPERAELPADFRRSATQKLRTLGIGYLLIDDADFIAEDLKKNMNLWGITEVAGVHGTHFYRIL